MYDAVNVSILGLSIGPFFFLHANDLVPSTMVLVLNAKYVELSNML